MTGSITTIRLRSDDSHVVDLLEEAVALRIPVSVMVRHGRQFVDHVREVVRGADEDWAVFESQGRIPVTEIVDCVRADAIGHRLAGEI